jgi:K+-sensing histidine kinase KdpD
MANNGKKKNAEKEGRMNKALVLAAGVVAWAVVAATAVLIVFNMGTKNQVLMFLPILAVVAAAWVIGELVTGAVFTEHEKGA